MLVAMALVVLLAGHGVHGDAKLAIKEECRQQAVEWCRTNQDHLVYASKGGTSDVWTIGSGSTATYACCHGTPASTTSCPQNSPRDNELRSIVNSCQASCTDSTKSCAAGRSSIDRHTYQVMAETRRASKGAQQGTEATSGAVASVAMEQGPHAQQCPKKGGKVCNNQGVCMDGQAQKMCACYSGFFGSACQYKHCPNYVWKSKPGTNQANRVVYHGGSGTDGGLTSPSDFIECSAHGKCHHDELIIGRRGDPTGIMGVGDPQRLGSQGENLNVGGTCECTWPYFGPDCSQEVCPVYEGKICNGQGSCDTAGHGSKAGVNRGETGARGKGTCTCKFPFYGSKCEKVHCPNPRRVSGSAQTKALTASRVDAWDYIECSGHGLCDSGTASTAVWHTGGGSKPGGTYGVAWGKCTCADPYSGADCSQKGCPVSNGKECGGAGECLRSDAHDLGRCACRAPWFGDSCEMKHCPGDVKNAIGTRVSTYGAALFKHAPGTQPAASYEGWTFCSGHGTCHLSQSTAGHAAGTCECNDAWDLTESCSEKRCPTHRGRTCNGEGVCNSKGLASIISQTGLPTGQALLTSEGGKFPGTCACQLPYYNGIKGACEMRLCPGSSLLPDTKIAKTDLPWREAERYVPCSGHGRCQHPNALMDNVPRTSANAPWSTWYGWIHRDARMHGGAGAEGGICECTTGYTGHDCSEKICPGRTADGLECGAQGACNKATGRCQCVSEHFGEGCQHRHCPGHIPRFHGKHPPKRPLWSTDFMECRGGTQESRGTCDLTTGTCTCLSQYHGKECEFLRCPSLNGRECNGQGTCTGGTHPGCKCFPGYEGTSCEHLKCPKWRRNNQVCGGAVRGRCLQDSGDCYCFTGYSGNDCSVAVGADL